MERRPIPARETAWAGRMADALVRRGVTANAISIWGMAFGLGAGALLAGTRAAAPAVLCWLAAAALVGLRLLANMLDGMVAERRQRSSAVGSLYNEVPDRISDVAILLGMGFSAGASSWLGWLAALLAVMTAYVRAQLAVSGAPQDFGGPMAKPHRMAVVIGAALLAAAGQPLGLPEGLIPELALAVIVAGSAATVFRRLWRGAEILRGRDA